MSTLPSGLTSAGNLQSNFLNLFVQQLQHQDPLDPMDNNQMTAQLAQLSTLEQLENMSNTFAKVLLSQQVSQATAMIGKQVQFVPSGQDTPLVGQVQAVNLSQGQVLLQVGDYSVDPASVQYITN